MADNIIKVNKNIGYRYITFTPTFYKRAYLNYKQGDYKDLLALIEHAEEDSFIGGCIAARQAGFKREFIVEPASESAQDVEIAEFVKTIFDKISFREFSEDVHDARMKYYSVLAMEWDIVNGKQMPVYYEKYEQKYFKYDKEDNILKIDFGKTLNDIPPDSAFVVESSRKPIMLLVLKDYIRKEFGEESWTSFLEVFGEPFIWAEYPPGASATQRSETETGVNAIAGSTRGIVPQGTKINIQESKRSTGDHKDYKIDCKKGISMALLGHEEAAGTDKTTQIGDNQTGIKVKEDIAIDDMVWLEEKYKAFVQMVVDRNYTTNSYPKIIYNKPDKVDLDTKLKFADSALNNGAQIDPEFYRKIGVPVIGDDPVKKKSFAEQFGTA